MDQKKIASSKVVNGMAFMIAGIVILITLAIAIILPQIKETQLLIPYCSHVVPINQESRMIIVVLLTGALGSIIHLISSFVKYVGTKTFEKNWIIWYILRPFIGMGLALTFYFTLRGGLLSANTSSEELNVYGIVTITTLAGMFSKQATEKLNELFENIFKTDQKGEDPNDDPEDDLKSSETESVEKETIQEEDKTEETEEEINSESTETEEISEDNKQDESVG